MGNREEGRHPSGWFGFVPFTLRLVPWLLSILHLGKKPFQASISVWALKCSGLLLIYSCSHSDVQLQRLTLSSPCPLNTRNGCWAWQPCWAGVRSVPCCWGCQMLWVPWCWHPPSHCSVLISPCHQHCWLAPGPRVLMKTLVWHPRGAQWWAEGS